MANQQQPQQQPQAAQQQQQQAARQQLAQRAQAAGLDPQMGLLDLVSTGSIARLLRFLADGLEGGWFGQAAGGPGA